MLAIINTLTINGIEAYPVKVEVDIRSGLPGFILVGLASQPTREATERVKSAIKNLGYNFPNRKIVVNLAPADLKKEGSHFDLPIALGILMASEQLPSYGLENFFFAGELSLDGSLRPVPGILPMALQLHHLQKGSPLSFVVPVGNSKEAGLVSEVHSLAAVNLGQICDSLEGKGALEVITNTHNRNSTRTDGVLDFADVKGQESAKRALQVAAAGQHNVLLIGPPGGGKTMLARRMPGLMPEMIRKEILETTRIYSVANLLDAEHPLIDTRPFRAPHKSASSASIIGGGRIPRPGEISLAQNGILFLDELPEFNRNVLESLRQPLEDQIVTITRTQATFTYPCSFLLIASMNPCLCGFFNSESQECTCTPLQIHRYLSRISGPLLDRMDLHVEVPRVNFEDLHDGRSGESSASMKAKVITAREIQNRRFSHYNISLNSQMRPAEVKKFCHLDEESEILLKKVFEQLHMSARSYDRILKLARTIADLEGEENIQLSHIAEALQYRSLDKKYWQA